VTDRAPDATHVERLKAVGRYALGVEWGDRHDSILPFRTLRAACPCDSCTSRDPEAPLDGAAESLAEVQLLGEESVFLKWADGHETLLLVGEVRDLCRCARCVGEPDYPISGR
jgi:DUF971 family protein